ncbi:MULTISPECIES: DUF7149 domain-containing protein [Helicobacter]|uniref:type IIG restriction enzyme/methyltransferase n=1 Tax=Helicobacter TaxID=209 RepID=UPI002627E090|nr:DNA methyltransferase [Helicobacter sp. UBA3407]
MPLQFQPLTPKEFFASCNKDYAESKISELEEFKEKVAQYLESLDKHKKQNEKAIVANVLAPFLLDLGFQAQAAYKHKGNSEIDLALLKDSQVEILIEAKTQKNKTEMFSAENPNCKALHECILYYLRERENNNAIKYILITDFYQFYLFRAKEFERYFYKNKKIQDAYKSLNKKDLLENQKDFYAELAKILSKDFQGNLEEDATLQGTHFDLRNDKHLESASKLLSRELLHNEFHRDSNALNPKFYYELLHILGLKEIETKGKILIQIDEAQKSSFAKHIASKLESQNQPSDFETTMSHIILWLNRILFLKLIEANLLHFNDFDKNLRFLTSTKITSFSILAHLFFEVLAKDYAERKQDKGFNFLPYLNSSLFIRDEKEICDLSALDDALEILPFATTQTEYKKREPVRFLTYLFDFLECFDFGKSQDSTPSDKLINSSVLGAMFEKLNGYQEGSFYTPNFITSYMCKESLQKIVLEKFNTAFDWDAKDLESLRKQIDRNFSEKEADFKRLLESIRICDPSVGSGHFLVSALNEMIGIYHHLGLLGFGYKSLEVQEDEILLTTKEGVRFAYKRLEDENHQIQISLFNLKKSIIENNLFGVDINPNSCNIARLRLWIELLKNAYYLNFSKDQDCKIHKLQTLPNIDINIKCGNSLISRFNLSDSLRTIPNINFQIEQYKKLVFEYKNADQSLMTISKKDIEKQIETIQATFTLTLKDPKTKRELEKAIESHIKQFNNYLLDDESLLEGLGSLQFNLFGTPTLSEEEQERALESYGKIQALRKKLTLALSGAEYKNAFEWRFAFPEVLDSNGDFLGFDLVIGNPPYGVELTKFQREQYKNIYKISNTDTAALFILKSDSLLAKNGINSLIVPKALTFASNWKQIRDFIKPTFFLLTDCGKAWSYVLLEMVIFARQKEVQHATYHTRFLQDDTYMESKETIQDSIMEIDKKFIDLFDFIPNNLSQEELDIGIKIRENHHFTLADCGENIWGDVFYKDITESENDFLVLGGKEIQRYSIRGIKGYVSKTIKMSNKANIKINSVLMQRIIAHIENPTPHIKMTGHILETDIDKIKIVNTVHQIVCKGNISNRYILGLLHSTFLNWYCYRFTFAKAIRSFQFSNEMAKRIPIPKITKQNQKIVDKIIALVDEILNLKAKDSTFDTSALESEIDSLIYQLYNLTDEEIKIVKET